MLSLAPSGLVQVHFRALVIGHGFAQALPDGFDPAFEVVEDIGCAPAFEPDQHGRAAGVLDQGAHRAAVHRALDEIALAMAGNNARGDRWGPQVNRGHVVQPTDAGGAAACARPAR